MKKEDIQEKAKQKVEAKKGFYITTFIFACLSVILMVLAIALPIPSNASLWLLFPILVFAMVTGIMYLSIFGIPGTRLLSADWEEEELNREMHRLYRQKGIRLREEADLTEEDRLELKELERLRHKWEERDDFV